MVSISLGYTLVLKVTVCERDETIGTNPRLSVHFIGILIVSPMIIKYTDIIK